MFSLTRLPGHCLLCGSTYRDEKGLTTHYLSLCAGCAGDLPRISHPCYSCALPLASSETSLCGKCLKAPPLFSRCIAPFSYSPPIQQLITGIKHRQQLSYGYLLGELLSHEIAESYKSTPQPDMIVPIPLHKLRLKERGFNQASEIAHHLGNKTFRHGRIPIKPDLIGRSIATPNQQGLSAIERRKNLRNAFQVSQRVDGKSIALVDDVVTTTSTALEVSRVLLKAGAKEIHIWALARTLL